jgi:alpha-mannosidase
MYEITKRLENLLSTLKKEINSDEIVIHDIQMKKLAYNERATFLDENEGYQSFEAGERFGELDQHYCFKAKICLPKSYIGNRVVLQLKTGATDIWNTDNPQFILYLNKQMLCAFDMNHYECILSEQGEDKEYEIALYAYTNTSQKDVALDLRVALQHVEVQDLYYDLLVPFETAILLKDSDDRRIDMLKVINETMNLIDFRITGSKEFYASILGAKDYFEEEFYEKMCRESDISVYSIGHTHIDIAWKWRVRQTREKVIRSFSTVLYLMDKYPDYKFLSSQPQLYQFVKEDAPQLYEKIKERVREGRWETEGAMWLEADCNLSSGESLIRHVIYGKKFFKEEFDKEDNVILWLPDVFGYSAALPQILKKSGVKYFMTTKIGWNEYNKIPNDTFLWKGIDGSEILTYFITTRDYDKDPELKRAPDISTTYNGLQNPSQIMGTWQRYQNKDLTKNVLTCYGYGDGGGGTTPKMLEQSKRLKRGIPGCPVVKQTFAREFFETLESNLNGKQIPKWCGDLYLEFHRGTYTSMGRNKKNNRKMEFALLTAEFFQTVALIKDDSFEYDKIQLDEAWKLLLLNQFHDILPGSSIKEVYEDSDIDYEKIDAITTNLCTKALNTLKAMDADKSVKENVIFVWNTLSFARDEVILLPEGISRVLHHGKELKVQYSEQGYECYVPNIPANGYTVLSYMVEKEHKSCPIKKLEDDCKSFETNYYKVRFNEAGEFISLYDKIADREVLKEGVSSNQLLVYEDRPYEFDAWNIDNFYTEKCYLVDEIVSWEIERGILSTKVHYKKKFLNSVITQDIIFYETSKRIDFKTEVDWKQEQLLLKAKFALDLVTTKAICDIQYGNVVRNTHKNTSWEQAQYEVCAHKWVDLSEASYGVSLMNDCKYGYSFEESDISITLIKSGIFPYPDADKEIHQFTYSLYPHEGDFRVGKVNQKAYQLNVPCLLSKTSLMNARVEDFTLFGALPENVILESMKRAEDSDEIILRFYEAHGERNKVMLDLNQLSAKRAWLCSMLEEKEIELPINDKNTIFEIKPYEIITISIERL